MSKNTIFISLVLMIGVSYTLYRLHLQPSEFTPVASASASQLADSHLKGDTNSPKKPVVVSKKKVVIQLSGAVVKPGIYEVEENTRLQQALDRAGGPLVTADLEKVNLVAKVKDGRLYKIPELKDKEENANAKINPKIKAKAASEENSQTVKFPININFATEDELTQIPGIGTVSAQAIVNLRMRVGHFGSLHDLLEIKGIGPGTLKKIAPYVTL